MLSITVPKSEFFDERTNEFLSTPETTLLMEHSLVSLSKWESEWEKPFLAPVERSTEETLSYIKAMTLTPNVPPEIYPQLTRDNLVEINDYIAAKMTATWFRETNSPANREIITAELIYYWMITLTIPLECETWHLTRLFTLIKVFHQKNSKQKKMSPRELAQRNRELNEQRQKQLGTSG